MATRWGILATGRIAHTFANAVNLSSTGTLVAVGSRTQESADRFAETWKGTRAHGSYSELLKDPEVDAIYISTPHPQHYEWCIRALEAKKAVLCEKPMGINHPEVMAMINAAQRNEQLLVEAFMYRFHPQTIRLRELLADEVVGEIRHVHATFGFHAPFNPESRLFSKALAGGGIMDVGCYPVSMVRMIFGREPVSVFAGGMLTPTGVDAATAALLTFDGGITAHVATGVGQQFDNTVTIYGSNGRIHVSFPWLCPAAWEIDVIVGQDKTTESGSGLNPYVYEIDEIDACRTASALESPIMDWDDSLGNAFVLDQWRKALDITFPQEEKDTLVAPVYGLPIAQNQAAMQYASITTEKETLQLSRLVMGCDNQPSLVHAAIMFDEFYSNGGTTFDTAYIYGGGRMESYLGSWIKSRDVRDSVQVIGKGAHSPLNFPAYIRPQLEQSLDRLQTDHLDVYFLHRDNEDVPVGEWVDALNDLCSEGLIRAFGGSNWSLDRVRRANTYAEKNKKQKLTALSNQFSLARMNEPIWPGCISANDPDFLNYLVADEISLMPWSSQARGFFTDRPDQIQASGNSAIDTRSWAQPADVEMQRCWFSDDNFQRRRQAFALAKEKNCEPIQIALAFVLGQRVQTFPLIGPRFLAELTSCLGALKIRLSVEEMHKLVHPATAA